MAGTSKKRHALERSLLIAVLIEAREQSGISQRLLAQRLKVQRSQVANIELGERELRVVELPIWALALRTTARILLGRYERALKKVHDEARRKRKQREHKRRVASRMGATKRTSA